MNKNVYYMQKFIFKIVKSRLLNSIWFKRKSSISTKWLKHVLKFGDVICISLCNDEFSMVPSFKSCWLGKWFDLQQTHAYEKLHSNIFACVFAFSQNEWKKYKGMKSFIYILITLTLRGNASHFGKCCNNSFSSLFGFSE